MPKVKGHGSFSLHLTGLKIVRCLSTSILYDWLSVFLSSPFTSCHQTRASCEIGRHPATRVVCLSWGSIVCCSTMGVCVPIGCDCMISSPPCYLVPAGIGGKPADLNYGNDRFFGVAIFRKEVVKWNRTGRPYKTKHDKHL